MSAGEEVDEEGEDDGADGGDDDADDEAVLAGAAVAQGAEDFSADDGANQADDHVEEDAVASAFHDLAGEPARYDTDDDPGNDSVTHDVPPERCGGSGVQSVQDGPARTARVLIAWVDRGEGLGKDGCKPDKIHC